MSILGIADDYFLRLPFIPSWITVKKNVAKGAEMERLERITYIDQILGKATKAVSSLSEALGKYSAGKIPIKLKWGVQSEDAVYNLPADATKLEEQAKNLAIQ